MLVNPLCSLMTSDMRYLIKSSANLSVLKKSFKRCFIDSILFKCYSKIFYNYSISIEKRSNDLTNTVFFFLVDFLSGENRDNQILLLQTLGHLLEENEELVGLVNDIGYDEIISSMNFETEETQKLLSKVQTLIQ